jgi:hypothetical protein
MDYTIIKFGEVTEEMMREMVHVVDRQCFPDEQHDTDYERALYKRNNHTLCALYHSRCNDSQTSDNYIRRNDIYIKSRYDSRSRLSYCDEKIIGYIEMLPLSEVACDELTQGVFDVEVFSPEHIAQYKQGLTNVTLYVRTLAVLPEYGKMTASMRLISEAAAFALKLADDGIKVNEMLAYFTNDKLEKILARRGFKQKYVSQDGLSIYSLPAELIHLFV